MENYKPNSHKLKAQQKENEKRVEKPVVTGKVVTKKPSKIRKFAGEIISEDAKNVKSYVLSEVLIPSIKKAISDIVRDGIDIILFGESGRSSKRSLSDRISYSSYSNRDYRSSRNDRGPVNVGYSYDDIVLSTRGEAEDVLARMDELMDTYQLVRVADLYDLVGISGNYTDNKYGWTSIRNAEVVRVRDGYMIKMPRAVPID